MPKSLPVSLLPAVSAAGIISPTVVDMLFAAFLWMGGSGRGHTAETPRPERHPAPAGR